MFYTIDIDDLVDFRDDVQVVLKQLNEIVDQMEKVNEGSGIDRERFIEWKEKNNFSDEALDEMFVILFGGI